MMAEGGIDAIPVESNPQEGYRADWQQPAAYQAAPAPAKEAA